MLRKICFLVIALHCGFIGSLLLSPPTHKMAPVREKLVVHTQKLNPPVKKQAAPKQQTTSAPSKPKPSAKKPPPKKPNEPVKEKAAPPQPKVATKKKEAKTPAIPPAKPKAEPPPPAPAPDLWQELDEALAKIETKTTPQPAYTPPPSSFSFSTETSGYEEALISHLQSSLNLPEFGEVKIELTLEADGRVAKMIVLKAESVKNREYLEHTIPFLRFPPLKEEALKQKTFRLTFCNDL